MVNKENDTQLPAEEQSLQDGAGKADQKQNADNSAASDETSDNPDNDQQPETQESEARESESEHKALLEEKDLVIKALEEKNRELNDKYLRLFSEFDNFRKRSIKEKQELTKTASAHIIEAVLPVLDDLERARQAAIDSPDVDNLLEGINLIQAKLKTTFTQKGLEEIPGVGEDFNTDYHEAISNVPAKSKKDKGKVIDLVQKGYILNGKVLRFAKVVVAN